MKEVAIVAEKYNCVIVEDACHAPGALYNKGNPVGACKYGIASTFSFHVIKHIAMGEEECITTNDKSLFNNVCIKRNHGIIRNKNFFKNTKEKNSKWYYEMQKLVKTVVR